MDYRKFHRTNVIIEFIGDAMAAVLAVINIFIADGYAAAPLMSMMAGQIIKYIREIILTGRDGYKQEDYLASIEASCIDNHGRIAFKTILSISVVGFVIIKLIIRQVSL